MVKAFPIDFIRQVIIQGLFQEKVKNNLLVGGDNEVNLFSFYEQLQGGADVDRFTDIYRDLVNQENRVGLIANGVIVSPDNPTITNLNQCTIIPLTFTCSFRCTLADRDLVLDSVNNLISVYKGRKVDIAEFENGKLFMVGTIANNSFGTPKLSNGDYLGEQVGGDTTTFITNKMTALASLGIDTTPIYPQWFYLGYRPNALSKRYMRVAYKENSGSSWEIITDDGTKQFIPFPQVAQEYTKWQVSISFDSIRCDEPRNLNAEEYISISFGGSATIVNSSVLLGNQMTKLGITKKKIVASTDITISDNTYWLEPLELPSGANAGTQASQLLANRFLVNSHTDNLTISNQYTFILDMDIPLIKQMFKYARYGIQADGTNIAYTNGISPNMIYEIKEVWSCWGDIDISSYNAKLVESIDIENTESDVLSISATFQLQGDNN